MKTEKKIVSWNITNENVITERLWIGPTLYANVSSVPWTKEAGVYNGTSMLEIVGFAWNDTRFLKIIFKRTMNAAFMV